MEVSEISDNGQISIPLELRKKYNLNTGDTIILKEREDGLLIVPQTRLSKLMGIYPENGFLEELKSLRREEQIIQ